MVATALSGKTFGERFQHRAASKITGPLF